MRNILVTVIILSVFLTSCGTLEMTVEDPSKPTPPAAPTSLAAGPEPLGMDSTSSEIRQTLLDSPHRWQTIFMDAQITASGQEPRRVQVWVDQPNLAVRSLSGAPNGPASDLRIANHTSLLYLDTATGESKLVPFLDESMSVPYTPAPVTIRPNEIQSHPLSTAPDPAMSILLFPSDIAQNEGTFTPVTTEVVAYHLCLVVDWTYIQESLPSYRAWVDVATGVFLRYQEFDKSGSTNVLSEVSVTRVDYDQSFPGDLFSLTVTAMPDFSTDPVVAAAAPATPAEFVETDPRGSVYSYVADNSYPTRVIRLIRVPASCVTGEADCPEAEVIKMPVELTSSLQPLVWSPAHNEAAWAYPINPDQRIWTLYLFNPADNSWAELASFDRYMDPPMWTRNGEWLAFRLQDGNGGSEIYAIRRDGTNMKILTSLDGLPAEGKPYMMDSTLAGNFILRPARLGENGTLYLVHPDDGSVTPFLETLLTKSPFLESPDGSAIATVDYDYNSQKQVVKLLTPDGRTSLRDLATFASGSILGLTWSVDGGQLAFNQRTDAASILYVIDSDGRNLRQVYTSTTDVQFVFSPDGKYLLAETTDGTGEHLYSINLGSLELHLVQVPGVALNEAWMFPSWR